MPHASLQVYAQCKYENKKIGPKYIRELAGAFGKIAHDERGLGNTLALLCSSSNFTSKAIEAMLAFSGPMCLSVFKFPDTFSTSEPIDIQGELIQLIWNEAAGKILHDLDARVVHKKRGTGLVEQLRLFYQGRTLTPVKK